MKVPWKPTSLLLVGVLFILHLSGPAAALEGPGNLGQIDKADAITSGFLQPQKNVDINLPKSGKDTDAITSGFLQPQKNIDLGKLKVGEDTVLYPWASRQAKSMRLSFPDANSKVAKNEEIIMDKSHSSAKVKDISAINTIEKRDLSYEDTQNVDLKSQEQANSVDINVRGQENARDGWPKMDFEINEIEGLKEATLKPSIPENAYEGRAPNGNQLGNYMNIDVSGITVSATNTVEGGTAIATSNIIIEPVQIININPAVADKLI